MSYDNFSTMLRSRRTTSAQRSHSMEMQRNLKGTHPSLHQFIDFRHLHESPTFEVFVSLMIFESGLEVHILDANLRRAAGSIISHSVIGSMVIANIIFLLDFGAFIYMYINIKTALICVFVKY